jgi:hypothetical protein
VAVEGKGFHPGFALTQNGDADGVLKIAYAGAQCGRRIQEIGRNRSTNKGAERLTSGRFFDFAKTLDRLPAQYSCVRMH